MRASPAAAQRGKGTRSVKQTSRKVAQEASKGVGIVPLGIVFGGLVAAGALFASLPKPDFYANRAAQSSQAQPQGSAQAPAPLPPKKGAPAYSPATPSPSGAAAKPPPQAQSTRDARVEGPPLLGS